MIEEGAAMIVQAQFRGRKMRQAATAITSAAAATAAAGRMVMVQADEDLDDLM
jgi:hypothetical protein